MGKVEEEKAEKKIAGKKNFKEKRKRLIRVFGHGRKPRLEGAVRPDFGFFQFRGFRTTRQWVCSLTEISKMLPFPFTAKPIPLSCFAKALRSIPPLLFNPHLKMTLNLPANHYM
ncbi:hypothetical protein QQP08_004561 [Theobroma cacao]|nr:hypothetical protein QQP08_004561 [Theobroma cacao]